jgi:hypothetical protein
LGAPDGCVADALCFPEPDPLVLELCASSETPAWVDPMLEELAASLVVNLAGAPAGIGCSLSGCRHIPGGHSSEGCQVDIGLASNVASAGAATIHVTSGDVP